MIATLVAKLVSEHTLSLDEYAALIDARTSALADELAGRARETCEAAYGDAVFARGVSEFTNGCKNDCYYCGIRRSNRACERYRLAPEQILACADAGWQAGFRTFVLQGGEDPAATDEWLAGVVADLKAAYPGCAVTLSVGERSRESYRHLRAAGADRYLLRHETATAAHYRQLHPAAMTLQRRMACLSDLREAGFAVGAGFMVGSPFQTTEHLAADLAFIQEFRPEMCGIGPFVPHRDTPFAAEAPGTVELTCYLLPRASGASDGAAAGYHGPGSAGSPQPREGHPRWRQRRDAELVAARAPGRLCALRRQAPLVGRCGPQMGRPGGAA